MEPKRPTFGGYLWLLARTTFLLGEETTSRIVYGGAAVLAGGGLVPLLGHLLGEVHWPIWITPALYGGGLLVSLVRASYLLWADSERRGIESDARSREVEGQLRAELEAARSSGAPSLNQVLDVGLMPPHPLPHSQRSAELGRSLVLQLKLTEKAGHAIHRLIGFVSALERADDNGWVPAQYHGPQMFSMDLNPGAERFFNFVTAWEGSPGTPGQFLSQGNSITPGSYRGVMAFEASDFGAITVPFTFGLHEKDGSAVLDWEGPSSETPRQTG